MVEIYKENPDPVKHYKNHSTFLIFLPCLPDVLLFISAFVFLVYGSV